MVLTSYAAFLCIFDFVLYLYLQGVCYLYPLQQLFVLMNWRHFCTYSFFCACNYGGFKKISDTNKSLKKE